ncbi:MAG: DUF1289 domain-containing protein [Alphaproteobacteria bacterium]|nr:DUF1289 domain-containing protein [Alphaproteobacteria bacterium]
MKPIIARLVRRLPEVLTQADHLPSPCQSVCVMNESKGWCEGCLRTLPEIAVWGSLRDEQKRDIWRQIGERANA